LSGADTGIQLEKIVQFAATLPNDSELRNDLSSKFIEKLWDGLQHPPIAYLGDEFKYRKADGSNNVSRPCLVLSAWL